MSQYRHVSKLVKMVHKVESDEYIVSGILGRSGGTGGSYNLNDSNSLQTGRLADLDVRLPIRAATSC